MTTQDDRAARQGFKNFNRFMLLLWRLGLGRFINMWPTFLGQILVITHTGRKSRLPRRTPANFAMVEGEIYCSAGFGSASDWYRNIQANPKIQVWLPEGWYDAEVEEVTGEENRVKLIRAVLIGAGFASVFAGLDPKTASDEELDNKTRHYRLLHLRLINPRTGPGGPGDLAWVWPLATFVLLPMVFKRNKHRDCC